MRVILLILDGWGIGSPSHGNAITSSSTPGINSIETSYPSCLLQASGIAVGLPWGESGNSEVGHLNIGAGRIVLQYLPRIVTAIRDDSFFKNKALKKAALHVKNNRSSFHIMGLLSSGSVHSYIDHLHALLQFTKREKISNVYLHIFTDGKDGPPQEAAKFTAELKKRMTAQNLGEISTIIGRIYAMDRNGNWQYTQKTYDLLTQGKGEIIDDSVEYLEKSYKKGLNDQYIEAAVVRSKRNPKLNFGQNKSLTLDSGLITDNDAVVFFNFREDSARQLTHAFIDDKFEQFPRKKIKNLAFVAMTQYYNSLPSSMVAFPPLEISNPLAEVLQTYNKRQLHIAELEKYAHVTYFFNGLHEKAHEGEERILLPSQGAPHYENYPEMQASKITDKIVENINNFDFMLVNFANADMLAHTGDIQAAIKGVETIDGCIKKILNAADENTAIIITADHGSAEEMLDPKTGAPKTEHTTNPVPFYLIRKNKKSVYSQPLLGQKIKGVLADIAPTILKLMEVPIPKEMEGQSLLALLK